MVLKVKKSNPKLLAPWDDNLKLGPTHEHEAHSMNSHWVLNELAGEDQKGPKSQNTPKGRKEKRKL